MCQGLPCVGTEVRFLIEVHDGGRIIPANSQGTVRGEDPATRELIVEVASGAFAMLVRVSEDHVSIVKRS
jgi:hypothetical protein